MSEDVPYHGSERHKKSIQAARLLTLEKQECKHCHEQVARSNFSKHASACLYDDANARHCLGCGIRLFKKEQKKFCSTSCSATVSNKGQKRSEMYGGTTTHRSNGFMREGLPYVCAGCGEEKLTKKASYGVVCSAKCQQAHRWETIVKPSIERGEGRGCGPAVRRYLQERDGDGCSCCHVSEWNGNTMTMDIDHIDGDHRNNKPENLRLLCPNCHRQTSTWGKKNVIRYEGSGKREYKHRRKEWSKTGESNPANRTPDAADDPASSS